MTRPIRSSAATPCGWRPFCFGTYEAEVVSKITLRRGESLVFGDGLVVTNRGKATTHLLVIASGSMERTFADQAPGQMFRMGYRGSLVIGDRRIINDRRSVFGAVLEVTTGYDVVQDARQYPKDGQLAHAG